MRYNDEIRLSITQDSDGRGTYVALSPESARALAERLLALASAGAPAPAPSRPLPILVFADHQAEAARWAHSQGYRGAGYSPSGGWLHITHPAQLHGRQGNQYHILGVPRYYPSHEGVSFYRLQRFDG